MNDDSDSQLITDVRRILTNAYLAELEANCRMFVTSWDELRATAGTLPKPGPTEGEQRLMRLWLYALWGRVYAMTGAGRRIVRILWRWEGARTFRSDLGVVPPHALEKDAPVVELGNALEHTETRIPGFARRATRLPLSGWGATNDSSDDCHLKPTQFRRLNISTWVCNVRDSHGEHLCDLRELGEAVRELLVSLPESAGAMFTRVSATPPH